MCVQRACIGYVHIWADEEGGKREREERERGERERERERERVRYHVDLIVSNKDESPCTDIFIG